jgi:pimeloyl-ACP methyl ester carboxylesterase
VAKAQELASRVPRAELRLIQAAGHLVQEDAPAELTAAVLDFFYDLGSDRQ